MTGSQESGMATASSTAPPKVMVPLGAAAVSAPKMVPERTAVKRKRAVNDKDVDPSKGCHPHDNP